MKASIHVLITPSLLDILKSITSELDKIESLKKRKRRIITKSIVCEELVKRCYEKGVVKL